MPEIKTREVVQGTIKTLDRSAVIGERMKKAYIKTKDKAEHSVYSSESSPEEYASDRIGDSASTVIQEAGYQSDRQVQRFIRGRNEKAETPNQEYRQNQPRQRGGSQDQSRQSAGTNPPSQQHTGSQRYPSQTNSSRAGTPQGREIPNSIHTDTSPAPSVPRQTASRSGASLPITRTTEHPHQSIAGGDWISVREDAVRATTDPDNPLDVVTMDEERKEILEEVFWDMNEIDFETETRTETEMQEIEDENGDLVETPVDVDKDYLMITISHKTPEEMADLYGFDDSQREQLEQLLNEEFASMWLSVFYGIRVGESDIVAVALSQLGNVGGEPYWSWYGFPSREEWCACFVSWCAEQCGYIEAGVIPKFAGCDWGVYFFRSRGQWADGAATPVPGMIIFFDWDNKGRSGPQDGTSDHVGIVEWVEDGTVYTIEGNSGDACRQRSYSIGHFEILGYGMPEY